MKAVNDTSDYRAVTNRKVRGPNAQLVLEDGTTVLARRFAPVGPGDMIASADGNVCVLAKHHRQSIPITPTWTWETRLDVAGQLQVVVKEVETADELDGYRRLTAFHYRGSGGAGRRVPLVAIVSAWELPPVVGFIELSSTFLVNTARSKVFDARFCDPERAIGWTRWENSTARRFGNAVVRISRCVVFPELRGLGLSRLLAEAAVAYARDRWHIGGLRPSFIEITAEMLRYWPFVRSAGFQYAGETEGNQHRAAKDMRYLLSRKLGTHGLPQGGGGIMSAQRAYATTLAEVMNNRSLSIEQVVRLLAQSPEKLGDEEWVELHKVFRRPKPTYIRGLTRAGEEFVARRLGSTSKNVALPNPGPRIRISKLGVLAVGKPTSSARARRVQEAFGIVATEFRSSLISDFDLELLPGEILLVGGPSGSGKSLLLKAIRSFLSTDRRNCRLPDGVVVEGECDTARLRVGTLQPVPANRAPIELLESFSLDESLRILASAGLAEPQLFVRRAKTLSVGQTYRLSLALALAQRPDLLLVDEFCEPLDTFTTAAVARRLRHTATSMYLPVVAATADPRRVVTDLRPTKLLLLSSDGSHKVISDPNSWSDAVNYA